MGFELPADPGDPGQPDVRTGRVDGSLAGAHRRLLRDGAQVLAHGALVCPSCAIPLVATAPFPAGARLVCGYCEHAAPAREFLAEDVYDTVSNEVYLVARVA
jgi:uncharacterized Zn finger protein (UPF0148 family)